MSRFHRAARTFKGCPAPIGLFGGDDSLPSSYGVPDMRSETRHDASYRELQEARPTWARLTHTDRMELLLALNSPDIDQCPGWLVLAFERSSFIDGGVN